MAECLFIKADEVVKMLGVSQSEAYRIIKKLKHFASNALLDCRLIVFSSFLQTESQFIILFWLHVYRRVIYRS